LTTLPLPSRSWLPTTCSPPLFGPPSPAWPPSPPLLLPEDPPLLPELLPDPPLLPPEDPPLLPELLPDPPLLPPEDPPLLPELLPDPPLLLPLLLLLLLPPSSSPGGPDAPPDDEPHAVTHAMNVVTAPTPRTRSAMAAILDSNVHWRQRNVIAVLAFGVTVPVAPPPEAGHAPRTNELGAHVE
jgi:hypothetical protein